MWSKDSWKNFTAKQQPKYENPTEVDSISTQLEKLPGIVSYNSIITLRRELIEVENSSKILLQVGDCAESFDDFSQELLDKFQEMMLDCTKIITRNSLKRCVTIGRIAGQFAKPRSSDTEQIDGKSFPAYRGDIVNEADINKRSPNPNRMLSAYNYSVAGVNYFSQINQDNQKIYTSHECLLLNYESSLIRHYNNDWYNSSAHMLWIGNRTRDLDGAHIEFLSGVINPIGIKIDEKINMTELIKIVKKLNPINDNGKIVLIARMGSDKIDSYLPNILIEWQKSNLNAIWSIDPMHGNGEVVNGYKTRNVVRILSEVNSFVKITATQKIKGIGFHFEATPNDFTECFSSDSNFSLIDKDSIPKNYKTKCDPRLNRSQLLKVLSLIEFDNYATTK